MENKIKHLEFIQSVINRMANNSFILKGWGITLFAGIVALIGSDKINFMSYVSVAPLVTFWFLDSYYLMIERKNRKLYNIVRLKKDSDIDFSMSIKEIKGDKTGYCHCLFSYTILVFYGTSLILSLVLLYFLA